MIYCPVQIFYRKLGWHLLIDEYLIVLPLCLTGGCLNFVAKLECDTEQIQELRDYTSRLTFLIVPNLTAQATRCFVQYKNRTYSSARIVQWIRDGEYVPRWEPLAGRFSSGRSEARETRLYLSSWKVIISKEDIEEQTL
jgi:hypothetical protein